MELKKYMSVIFGRLWIVILIPLIAAGTSAYISLYYLKPVYEANTTLYVINKKADPQVVIAQGDLLAGELLVKDYREIIKSRAVAGAAIDELKIQGLSPEALASKVSVNPKNDTRIIEIRVQDGNPERASELANKIGEVFIKKAVLLMKVENVEIVDKAQTPASPVSPKTNVNIGIAFFAGLAAAVGITFILEYLDNRIKTVEDVEKHLGLPVLGTIPTLDIK